MLESIAKAEKAAAESWRKSLYVDSHHGCGRLLGVGLEYIKHRLVVVARRIGSWKQEARQRWRRRRWERRPGRRDLRNGAVCFAAFYGKLLPRGAYISHEKSFCVSCSLFCPSLAEFVLTQSGAPSASPLTSLSFCGRPGPGRQRWDGSKTY